MPRKKPRFNLETKILILVCVVVAMALVGHQRADQQQCGFSNPRKVWGLTP